MQLGDFSQLAKNYVHRPSYNPMILEAILKIMDYRQKPDFKVAEIGAGTGKLTQILLDLGLDVTAVEPNDEMRREGQAQLKNPHLEWKKGSGENKDNKGNQHKYVY